METAALLESLLRFFDTGDWWKFASIPIVAGLVGWSTNWAAIKLTFLPLDFLGIPPYLGWQGIIPSKAGKMAAIFVDSTMDRLGSLPELFQRMEPEKIAAQINRIVLPRLGQYTDEVLRAEHPTLWANAPEVLRARVHDRVRVEMPTLVENLMAEASERVEELIDFKHMITTRLEEDPALLNRLFLESGDKEFRFIVRSGLYFGFAFGLVQLAVWFFYPVWWVLPVFGLLVGYATNWIALNIIFRPLYPVKIGPFRFQGLFLQRQVEVARVWCRLVTREIITVRSIVYAMMKGPMAETTHELVRKHIQPIVRESAGLLSLPAAITLGSDSLRDMEHTVGELAVEVSTDPFDDWHFNRDRAEVVEEILRERMENLSPEEFQDLLRPCFQEDELKLILVGAVLGCAAGTAQLVLVFGG